MLFFGTRDRDGNTSEISNNPPQTRNDYFILATLILSARAQRNNILFNLKDVRPSGSRIMSLGNYLLLRSFNVF
jgi:hypothetical protein